MTRQNYIDLCQELATDPVEHENQVLSIGSEFCQRVRAVFVTARKPPPPTGVG